MYLTVRINIFLFLVKPIFQMQAPFWQQAPFFRLFIPFACGICIAGNAGNIVPDSFILLMGFLALFALIYCHAKHNSNSLRLLFAVSLHVFLFSLGYFTLSESHVQPDVKSGGGLCSGVILDEPVQKSITTRLKVKLIARVSNNTISTVSSNRLVYLKKEDPSFFQVGDTIVLPDVWERISGSGNPFEFDYAGWYASQGIFYRQFCQSGSARLLSALNPSSVPYTVKLHAKVVRTLSTYINDSLSLGLIQSMLLGDESILDDGVRKSFSLTGIAHILAISGGNILCLLQLVIYAFFWINHKKYLKYKYLLAIPLIWFYIALTGASPSAVRAGIMFVFVALSIYFNGNKNPLNSLFASAFIMLCIWPGWLFSIGFQLSFTAVLSLLVFFKPIRRALADWMGSIGRKLRPIKPPKKDKEAVFARHFYDAIASATAASILVSPLVAFYFHSFPPLFLLANVFAALFSFVILFGGLLLLLCSPFSSLALLAGRLLVIAVKIFITLNNALAVSWPAFNHLYVGWVSLVLVYPLVIGVAVFLFFKLKNALYLAILAVCFLLVVGILNSTKVGYQRLLIVYNCSNSCPTELIESGTYHRLSDSAWHSPPIEAVAANTHIALSAGKQAFVEMPELVIVNGRRILLLSSMPSGSNTFPVDVVINNCGSTNLIKLKSLFNPSVVVIGNNIPKPQQTEMVQQAAQMGIKLHCTRLHGAFVLGYSENYAVF